MKEHPTAGGALQQFQVCIEEQETDDNTTVVFQGNELKGGSAAGRFGSNVSFNQAIEKSTDVTVKELKARFHNLLGSNKDQKAKHAVSSFRIFHHDTWSLSSKELLEFGIQEVGTFCSWFQVHLEAAGCNIEAVPAEWRQSKVLVSNSFHDKSYADLRKIMLTLHVSLLTCCTWLKLC